jgi:hypothetical protein
MRTIHQILYGGVVGNNPPPPDDTGAPVRIRGEFKGKNSCFAVTEEILSKHVLLVGGTGSGKTNLFYHFVSQLKGKLGRDDVMLVFDTKGDFHSRFFREGDVVIGNSSRYRAQSAKWSILAEAFADGGDGPSIEQNIREICKSLFSGRVERHNNPFFPNAACDLLASVIIALARKSGAGTGPTNESLSRYIGSASLDDIRALLSDNPDLKAVASYIGGKSPPQAQGVISELYSVAREVLSGVFAEAGGFSIRDFIRSKAGRTAFIEYDLAIGDILAPVYSLLFDLALKETLGQVATPGNVYLVADELKLLPNLRHLEDGVNFGRSSGLKIIAGLQNISQLNANYDREAKALNAVSGFSSVFAFRQSDYYTREHVSRLFGRNMLVEAFMEENSRIHYDKREGFTVEDWDLTSLTRGEAVVGLCEIPAFRFTFSLFNRAGA